MPLFVFLQLFALQQEMQHLSAEELLRWFAAADAHQLLACWSEVGLWAAPDQLVVCPGLLWELPLVCSRTPALVLLQLVLPLHILCHHWHDHFALGQQLTAGPCVICRPVPQGAL